MVKNKSLFVSGLVWILSGTALCLYAIYGLTDARLPGIEQLVNLVNQADGWYVYLAVLVAIFIEGLYVIGSVFPGSSIVILSAIVAQTSGASLFVSVLITIWIGWNIAGLVNVLLAKLFRNKLLQTLQKTESAVAHAEITWFPAFRANTEVAEVIEGKAVKSVLASSLRIKTFTVGALAIYALIIPLIIDINSLNNQEGFLGLIVVALISVGVGVQKLQEARKVIENTV